LLPRLKNQTLESIYFGGGTPSSLKQELIEKLLKDLKSYFNFSQTIEISFECNPEDANKDFLQALSALGITRISFGIQSLNHSFLKILGRRHSPEDCRQAIATAKNVGFTNINADLMTCLPNQTSEELEQDIDSYLELELAHYSVYELTVEVATPFYSRSLRGELPLPDEDLALKMLKTIAQKFTQRGYDNYEISNFSKPGFSSKHNLGYWSGWEYLGLGCGAHSYFYHEENKRVSAQRFANVSSVSAYKAKILQAKIPFAWTENLPFEKLSKDLILTGLRKLQGFQCAR
jgi:oxygen-independent coproporphyrinogen III oxidase